MSLSTPFSSSSQGCHRVVVVVTHNGPVSPPAPVGLAGESSNKPTVAANEARAYCVVREAWLGPSPTNNALVTRSTIVRAFHWPRATHLHRQRAAGQRLARAANYSACAPERPSRFSQRSTPKGHKAASKGPLRRVMAPNRAHHPCGPARRPPKRCRMYLNWPLHRWGLISAPGPPISSTPLFVLFFLLLPPRQPALPFVLLLCLPSTAAGQLRDLDQRHRLLLYIPSLSLFGSSASLFQLSSVQSFDP